MYSQDRINVLLVDDEASLPDLAARFLEKTDPRIRVDTTVSPEEALRKAEENAYDVIVADYHMPVVSGIDMLERLREQGDETPFIVFTGRGREEVAMEALNLGANRYIQKGGDPRSQFGVLAQAIIQEAQHHKTEREVEKFKKRFRELFHENPYPAMFIDPQDKTIKDVNQAGGDLTGYTREELTNMNLASLLPGGEAEADKAVQTIQDKGLYVSELRVLTRDGDQRLLNVTATYQVYEDEPVIQVIAEDITEKRRREEEIRDLNSLLKAIKSINEIIALEKDTDTIFHKTCEVLNHTRGYIYTSIGTIDEEGGITGRSTCEKAEEIGVEWQIDPAGGVPECLTRAIESGEPEINDHTEPYCNDCSYCDTGIPHKTLTVPMVYRGSVRGFISTAIDPTYDITGEEKELLEEVGRDLAFAVEKIKTEQRLLESEERFREVFSDITFALYIHEIGEDGAAGKIIDVNDVACERLGYTREEYRSMTPEDLVAGEAMLDYDEVMMEVVEEGQATFEVTHVAKDGERIPVEITAYRSTLNGKKLVVSVARDLHGMLRVYEMISQ